jgi:heterodisulfide reductase subunit C
MPGKRGPLRFIILNATGLDISVCAGCDACEQDCPRSDEWDVNPSQVLRWARADDERALACRTIWVCAECRACDVRCTNGVPFETIAAVLRAEAGLRGLPSPNRAEARYWGERGQG